MFLLTNQAFTKYPILRNTPARRSTLPAQRDPNFNPGIWGILRSAIGRDLTRISLPSLLNEPLSGTQRHAAFFRFAADVTRAGRTLSTAARLTGILSVLFANMADDRGRLRKPFNPLLGETFELVGPDFFSITEQVSHHPPITATYFESAELSFEANIQVRVSFSLAGGLDFSMRCPNALRLKNPDIACRVEFPGIKPINFFRGKPFFAMVGRLRIVSESCKSEAFIEFPDPSVQTESTFVVRGEARDEKGQLSLKIEGDFKRGLHAFDMKSSRSASLCAKSPVIPDAEFLYGFTEFTCNLNHLTPQTLSKLPPTDARLRPDIRAYENANYELADQEKHRLEELQRQKAKVIKDENRKHDPVWFDYHPDHHITFRYNRKYMEARSKGVWPDRIPKIY